MLYTVHFKHIHMIWHLGIFHPLYFLYVIDLGGYSIDENCIHHTLIITGLLQLYSCIQQFL